MDADEHWEFAVTVPAGTPKTAPLVQGTVLPARHITSISWTVPPGPSGLAGWRITMGGVQVIPVNPGAWIIRDGYYQGAALAKLPTSGAWDITGYNTGTFPHTIYVTFFAAIIRKIEQVPVPFGLDELQQTLASGLVHPPRGARLWFS